MRPFPGKFVAAMIALAPLPGAPLYKGSTDHIMERAMDDLRHYMAEGVDCVILENSHDLPYIKPPLPDDAVALVTDVAAAVRETFSGPVGIQLLEAANLTALEIANQTDLDFVRVEGYVYAHVGGAGIIEGCAGELHRQKHILGKSEVRFLADVNKKHCAHALTADLDILDIVRQTEFFLADGIIVTGPRTTSPPDVVELERIRTITELPIVIGSGMDQSNLATYFPLADGFIVGSTFRKGGRFTERLDPQRLSSFMDAYRNVPGNTP